MNDSEELVQEIIGDNDAFERLADDWISLIERSRSGSVFMRWEWHYTWWQVFAEKRSQLHIVTWRDRGRLVGVLPLYVHSSVLPGNTSLRFLGTGELQIDEVATEYGDLLAEQALEKRIAPMAAAYLISFKNWNRVDLLCLLDNAVVRQALAARQNIFQLERSAGLRYRIALQSDENSYLQSMDKGRAKRIRRSQRAALRDGGLTTKSIGSIDDFDRAFKELSELNHERQEHKQRKSVFASDRFRRFHHELCLRLYESGAVDVTRFYLNSRLLAILYCFYDAHTCHYYQSGFARKDANRYMPLTLSHMMEMQKNREAGRSYYDLMRGMPPCYKDDLGCETTAMVNLSLYSSPRLQQFAKLYRTTRSKIAERIKRHTA